MRFRYCRRPLAWQAYGDAAREMIATWLVGADGCRCADPSGYDCAGHLFSQSARSQSGVA